MVDEKTRYCPKCKSDWRGSRISDEVGYFAEYYSRLIGLEDPDVYDGISWWKCPDCGHIFEREF